MIKITDAAEDFLAKKSKDAVTIEYPASRVNCCAYNVPLPEVKIKEPTEKFLTNYNKVTIDHVRIFIARNVLWPKENWVTIDLENVLGFKRLTLDGWSVKELLES